MAVFCDHQSMKKKFQIRSKDFDLDLWIKMDPEVFDELLMTIEVIRRKAERVSN